MIDPRDAMLNAARALHDRADWDPSVCNTCRSESTGGNVRWPCPTALALGATGRSEWTTTPADPPDYQCRTWGPDGNDWPTNEEANYRCERPIGHTGNHTDTEGHQW